MTSNHALSRRSFLATGAAACVVTAFPAPAIATGRGSIGLNMINAHTDERFRYRLIENGRWVREAMIAFDWFARDWRQSTDKPIHTQTLLMLMKLQKDLDSPQPMVLLSGYRTRKTNNMLRGAAKDSLHMQGMAIDITQPGRDISDVHKAAVAMKRGGIGYYPRNNFIHIDAGPQRHWTS